MFKPIRITASPLVRIFALGCILLGVYLQEAAAASPSLPHVLVKVTPEMAVPGVTRTLTISGTWHSGCAPIAPHLGAEAESVDTRAVVVTLRSIDPVCLSFAPTSTFSYDVQYTPGKAGVMKVFVLEEQSGSSISEGQVVTRSAATTHSLFNLDGTWYSPAIPGSALALSHAFQGSDAMMGALFLYSNGQPRWYSIEEGNWVTPTRYVARLYEFDAAPQGCHPAVTGCPRPANPGRNFGRVEINVANDATLQIEATAGLTSYFDDVITLMFKLTLNRFTL